VKHPREDTSAYKRKLRYYLRVKGVAILEDGNLCCPNPEHEDHEYGAKLLESAEAGDSVQCESCATSWDIFDVDGLVGKLGNKPSTFARRLASVKDALATVLPEHKITDDLPLAEQTDEEAADLIRRQKEATRATVAARAHVRAEAEEVMDRERRKQNEGRARELPFRVLGTAPDGYTYFLDRDERLQCFRLGSLTKTQLQLLAPLDWWIRQFPGSRGRLETDGAIDFLIDISNGVSFEPASLRGRGCWREE
jgi:hypothetical protein